MPGHLASDPFQAPVWPSVRDRKPTRQDPCARRLFQGPLFTVRPETSVLVISFPFREMPRNQFFFCFVSVILSEREAGGGNLGVQSLF